jgi:polysaccharide biosynthesis/export protein
VLAQRVDLKRYDKTTGRFEISQYSLERLDELKSTNLVPRDEVVLYTRGLTENLDPTVNVVGAVKNPGLYSLEQNMYVEDALLSAGGFPNFAKDVKISLNRVDRDLDNGTYSKAIAVDLDLDYMLGRSSKPTNPILLQDKDVVRAVRPINADLQPLVEISGQVNYPGPVIIEKDVVKLSLLLESVGGLTKNAILESSYIIRDTLLLAARITEKSVNDINLKDGDRLYIGSLNDPIRTQGNLMTEMSFDWQEGKRANYYVRASGGLGSKNERTFITQANGSSKKIGFLKNPKVYPGSTIVAVAKPESINNRENTFLDDFIRIFSVLTGALTAALLASKL